MNNSDISRFINDLELRCPECGGNIKTSAYPDNIVLIHNLPIPGEKVPSNDSKCAFVNSDVKKAIADVQNDRISLGTLQDRLIDRLKARMV